MMNERHELVKALAVASYGNFRETVMREVWAQAIVADADALLVALDKDSPPAQDAADTTSPAPSQEGAGSAPAAPGGEPTNRDKALAGEVIKVSDKRLEEMQRQAVQFEGIETGHMHWHWAAVVNELIDLRKGGEPKERVCTRSPCERGPDGYCGRCHSSFY